MPNCSNSCNANGVCSNNSFLDKYKQVNSWGKYNLAGTKQGGACCNNCATGSQCQQQQQYSTSRSYPDLSSGSHHEVLQRAGPAQVYQPQGYLTEPGTTTQITTEITHQPAQCNTVQYRINEDPCPIRIVKPAQADCERQTVRVRYLQPPELPAPPPIIIKERQMTPPPPAPPIYIRQHMPAPPTPPPLVIRERPPCPPEMPQQTVIEKLIPPPTPPPRQVIVERIPAPEKPREVIYEKWLPYKPLPERQVIVERAKPAERQPAPKNVIIEYERPGVCPEKCVLDEGVIRADPRTYNAHQSCGREEVRVVDRITDMPVPNGRSVYAAPAPPQPVQTYSRPATAKITASSSNLTQAKGPATFNTPYNTTYRSSYTGKGYNSFK